MALSSAVTLVDLPTELLLQIISHVDYPSSLALSQSNKLFRTMITLEEPTTSEQKLLLLCALENWARYRNYFACSQCLKLRFRGTFADKQIKAKRGKGHAESDRRFCIDCGVKRRIYQPRQAIIINGDSHFVCALGRHLCDLDFYCTYCGACQPCLEREETLLGPAIKPYHVGHNCPRCSRSFTPLWESEKVTLNNPVTFPTPQDLFLSWKMAEFQECHGMMGSPEWYEEDIAHGNF